MISVLVKGYGLVVWHDATDWRAYGRSDALTATLTARVGMALTKTSDEAHDEAHDAAHDAVRDQLLRIHGAMLFADQPADEAPDLPEPQA